MARIYETLSGHRIEYPDPDPKLAKFLQRASALVDDKKATEDDLVALVYGSDNPILDHTLVPGRGSVTREVFENPVYHVLTDLIWRKSVLEKGVDLAKVAKRYSLTVKEAAEQLAVTPDAVRKAISARRVASWVKNGEYFLDPKGLTPLQKSAKPGRLPAGTEPLVVRAGNDGANQLHINYQGGLLPENVRDVVAETTIPRWRRAGVLTAGHGKLRLFVIEPSDQDEEIEFHGYHVRGKFKIVEKVNGSKAARLAWQGFEPA